MKYTIQPIVWYAIEKTGSETDLYYQLYSTQAGMKRKITTKCWQRGLTKVIIKSLLSI